LSNNNLKIKEEYEKLRLEYIALEKKYNRLDSRLNSITKINDKMFKSFFDKKITADKINKRLEVILKQSDKQSNKLLRSSQSNQKLLMEQSKIASMENMIDNISHQMKQPLSLILTSTSTLELKKEMDMLDEEEFFHFTNKIKSATKYLNDTIDNFKNFFKKEKEIEPFHLTHAIVSAKQLLETKFKGKNIKIVHNLDNIMVVGIQSDLIQVFANILSNSIDAMEKNSVLKLIFISSYVENDSIVVKFQDSGGGISNDIIGKIFNQDFSTKISDSKNPKGKGGKLFISKMIIENNFSGVIKVTNEKKIYENQEYTGACVAISLHK
jgi:signal transduction histidine kinase